MTNMELFIYFENLNFSKIFMWRILWKQSKQLIMLKKVMYDSFSYHRHKILKKTDN